MSLRKVTEVLKILKTTDLPLMEQIVLLLLANDTMLANSNAYNTFLDWQCDHWLQALNTATESLEYGGFIDLAYDRNGVGYWQLVRQENSERIALLPDMQTTSYNAYMRSPEWQHMRQKALRRAKYRCQLCNSPDFLHVHHRSYENLGNEDSADLTVLCTDCHRLFHRR